MGQLFVAAGPDHDEVKRLLRNGIRLFDIIVHVPPLNIIERDGIGLAAFDSIARPGGARICEYEHGVGAAVGAWFHDGTAQGALRPLVSAAAADTAALKGALERYDGFFAFALTTAQTLTVITDPLGRLHIYEACLGATRLVSTSALVLAALIGASWDPAGVRQFLALGYVLGQHSLFQGVKKLPPATVRSQSLRSGARVVDSTYWHLSDYVYSGGGRRGVDSVEALAETLHSTMHNILEAYARPAMDLTGGFDSRALLGAALHACPANRFGTAVSGQPDNGDVVAARGIADRFGLTLRELAPQPPDVGRWWELAQQAVPLVDGEYDVLEYACILNIHAGLAAEFGASINGSGGETCRGYWWELLLPFLGRRGHFDPRRVAAARFATDDWAESLLAEEFGESLERHIAELISDADMGLDTCLNTARMDNIYLMARMQRWQGRLASATGRLWPCFSPFLMKGPLQAALGATVSERLADRMARRVIDYFSPDLAALPMASGMPASPITWSNAHRFSRLPGQWGARAWHKAYRTLGGTRKATKRSSSKAVDLFWEHAAFRDCWFGPLTEGLYHGGALQRFLEQSREQSFAAPAHLGRIVTLELVARTLQAAI